MRRRSALTPSSTLPSAATAPGELDDWSIEGLWAYLAQLPDLDPRSENLRLPAIHAYCTAQLSEAEKQVYELDTQLGDRTRHVIAVREATVEHLDDEVHLTLAVEVDHAETAILKKAEESGQKLSRAPGAERLEKLAKGSAAYQSAREAARRERIRSSSDALCTQLRGQLADAIRARDAWKGVCRSLNIAAEAVRSEMNYQLAEIRNMGR